MYCSGERVWVDHPDAKPFVDNILTGWIYRQTVRHALSQTDIQTDRQTDRQTVRNRQIDLHTDGLTDAKPFVKILSQVTDRRIYRQTYL